MNEDIKSLTQYLGTFITETRKQKIEEVLNNRTDNLTLVLEDIFHPHNASATIRTCECLGIQNVHVIENRNRYKVNKGVTKGSGNWVNINKYQNSENCTKNCIDALKQNGYTIIATSLGKNTISLPEIDLTKKHALMFGTEEIGLSSYAINNADYCLKLPMYGFTQSYNISVSVAICFSYLIPKLYKLNNYKLSDEQIKILRYKWYKKSIKHVHRYEEYWQNNIKA